MRVFKTYNENRYFVLRLSFKIVFLSSQDKRMKK